MRFIFENDPSDDDREDVSLVETYVIADFEDSVSVDAVWVWLPAPFPRDLEAGEEWVYMRKEVATGDDGPPSPARLDSVS